MKLTVNQKVLAEAVSVVTRAVERRMTVPILSNVHLETMADTLKVTGTDMDIEVSVSIPADVEQDGLTTISATAFSELAKRIPPAADGILHLNQNADEKLEISTPRSKFELLTLPAGDFPVMAGPAKTNWTLKLSGTEFAALLDQVEHCISKDAARPYLEGVFLAVEDELADDPQLVTVATNGHQLAKTAISAPKGALSTQTRTVMPGIIIPEKTVRLLLRILSNKDGPIVLRITEEKLEMTAGTQRVISKLVDGVFPEYQRVIPSDNPIRILVDTDIMQEAVDFVKAVMDNPKNAVAVSLNPGSMSVDSSSTSIGEASDNFEIDYSGAALRIGLSAEYLSANLTKCACEHAEIFFGDSGSPIRIVPRTDRDTTLVIMPVRI